MSFGSSDVNILSAHTVRAQYSIDKYHDLHKQQGIWDLLPKLNSTDGYLGAITEDHPVCIIGAGAAGLFTALMLDSLNIPYVIYEASDRYGGRMFTYNGFRDAAPYDYIVRIPSMKVILYDISQFNIYRISVPCASQTTL